MQTNEMAYGAYGSQGATENRIKDYQNFLSNAPIQCFNCKPSEDGKVEGICEVHRSRVGVALEPC